MTKKNKIKHISKRVMGFIGGGMMLIVVVLVGNIIIDLIISTPECIEYDTSFNPLEGLAAIVFLLIYYSFVYEKLFKSE